MEENRKSSNFFDYEALFRQCINHWWWFAISIFLCALLGIVYAYRKPEIYVVEANVMVRPEKSSLGSIASTFDLGLGNLQSQEVDDELAFISSYSVMNQVVKDMQLNLNYWVKKNILKSENVPYMPPVRIGVNPEIADTLSTSLKFVIKANKGASDIEVTVEELTHKEKIAKVKASSFPFSVQTDYGLFILDKTENYNPKKSLKEVAIYSPYSSVTESLKDGLKISIPSRKSNDIRIVYETVNPEFGCMIVDNLINVYQSQEIARKKVQQQRTLNFVNERLRMLNEELATSEGNIEKFKQKNQLTDIAADATFALNKMGEVQKKLLEAETQLEIINLARTFIADPENKYSLIPVINSSNDANSSIDNKGIQEYNALVLKRVTLTNNAKGNNIALRNIEEQLDALRENITVSLNKSYNSQKIIVANLRTENNSTAGRLSQLPADERTYVNIKRQQTVQEGLYMYLLQLREETELNISNAVSRAEIVDNAFVYSDTIGMGMKKGMMAGAFVGFLIPIGLIFLMMKLKQKFQSKEEAEKMTFVPILGEICQSRAGNHIVVGHSTTSSTAELFRLMRTNLNFVLTGSTHKVILVTSSKSGEGKSFISTNLACSFALLKKKTLIIGADIRKPRLAEYFGIAPKWGLTQYLASDDVTIDMLVNHYADNEYLDIITAGPIPPNPAELLLSAKVATLIEWARDKYDYIIIDSAPVGMVSDTFSFAKYVDATLYVSRVDYTLAKDLKYANSIYVAHRLPKMVLVINGVGGKLGYGYGYGYGYGHEHDAKKKSILDIFKRK